MKRLLHDLCPPLAWRGLRTLYAGLPGRGRSGGPVFGPAALVDSLGDNTDLTGTVDRRGLKSRIVIGRDCLIEGFLVTERDESRLTIGDNVGIGGQTIVDCSLSITVEDNVLVSYQCVLADSDNHNFNASVRRSDLAEWRRRAYDWGKPTCKPILVCRDAWIGMRCIILKGVTIGQASIVGAGSVVTRDVPDFVIAAGNPARVVRPLTDAERAESRAT